MVNHRHYFRCTPWYHWLWVSAGISLETLLIVWPGALPYDSLGPIGSFLGYLAHQQPTLLRILLLTTVIIHIIEGTYAFTLTRYELIFSSVLCRPCITAMLINFRRMNLAAGDTILWTVQTTLLGFTSLLPLRAKYKQLVKHAQD